MIVFVLFPVEGHWLCNTERTPTLSDNSLLLACCVLYFVVEPPTVTIDPEQLSAVEGTSATLRCIANGMPAPIVRWSRSGGVLGPNHQV